MVNLPISSFSYIKDFFLYLRKKQIVRKSKINNVRTNPFIIKSGFLAKSGIVGYQTFHILHSISFEGQFGDNPEVYLIYDCFGSNITKNNKDHEFDKSEIVINKLNQTSLISNRYTYSVDKQTYYYSKNQESIQLKPFVLVICSKNAIGFTVLYYMNKSLNINKDVVAIPLIGQNQFVPFIADDRSWPSKWELEKIVKYGNNRYTLDSDEVTSILKLKNEVIKSINKKLVREAYDEEYGNR